VEFVLKQEDNHNRIKLSALQEVMIKFALHAKNESGQGGRAVIIAPVEHSKSSTITVGLSLYKLATAPETRIGFVSAAEKQAKKNLMSVRNCIDGSPELRLVAPHLRKSDQDGDPWTQSEITVVRPNREAHDPSIQAFGQDTKSISGSRLDLIILDDILTFENTWTAEQRTKLMSWAQSYAFNRRSPKGSIIVVNSAIHPEDLPHYLCFKLHWPTMILDAYGPIQFHNTTFGCDGQVGADLVEPESIGSSTCVLTKVRKQYANDPDKQVLFPERFSITRLENVRADTDLVAFLQSFRSITRNDADSMCKEEYIERCKENGRAIGLFAPILGQIKGQALAGDYYYLGKNPTFISVDLAVKQRDCNDKVAIAVVELVPQMTIKGVVVNGMRILLDLEIGRWPGPVILDKICAKVDRYGSETIVVVEDNGAQAYIRQFMAGKRIDIPVIPFNTSIQKHKFEYGIPGVFTEFANGAWAFPCTSDGKCVASVEDLIKQCLYYRPDKHTGDALMAIYFARDQAKRYMGAISTGKRGKGAIGMGILAR
jgi:hypothetical protein